MKLKKIAAVLLAFVLVFVIAGCGKAGILDKNNTLVTFDGDGYVVTRDLLNYYLLGYKEYCDKGDNAFWATNAELGTSVIAGSIGYYQEQYAMIKWANELGLGYTDADQSTLEDTINYYINNNGGEEAYNALLAKSYATPEVYRRLIAEDIVVQRLSEVVYADGSEFVTVTAADIADYSAKNPLFAAKHILILNESGDDKAANLAKIEEILAQLKSGADFDALMNEHSEDTGLATNPDGYVFGEGEMVASFENGVKALAVGEISGVIESNYGYHIIKRLEVSDSDYSELIIKDRIGDKVTGYMEGIKTEYSDGFLELNITDFVWPY